MFKEIAIDPAAVVASAVQFNNIIDRFGIPEGRLIAAFPSTWRKLVFEAAQTKLEGKMDLKRIEERLNNLPKTVFISRGRPGQGGNSSWVQAAIDEHRRSPFHAVIASIRVDEDGFVQPDDISNDHPSFAPNRQWNVKRDAKSMADCCSSLLNGSYHIKLIDYNFNASALRWKRPFQEFLRRTKSGATIDIFRDDDIQRSNYVTGVEDALKEVARIGAILRLFVRPKGTMHKRFVLTDKGGITFDIGLDQDFSGQKTHDIVTVLQEDIRMEQWEKYAGDDCFIKLDI